MTPELFEQWRKAMRLNASQAADALGCSRNSVRKWERGEHTIPKYIGLACAALSLEAGSLLLARECYERCRH